MGAARNLCKGEKGELKTLAEDFGLFFYTGGTFREPLGRVKVMMGDSRKL